MEELQVLYSIGYPKSNTHVFPLLLSNLGIHHLQEPIQRPHGLPLYQWFYCVKGKGEIIIDHQKSILHPGDGALIYPETSYTEKGLTSDWTVHFFGFYGAACDEIMRSLNMNESGVYHFNDKSIFLNNIQKLHYMCQRDLPHLHAELSKECYNFLVDLSFYIERIHIVTPAEDHALTGKIISYLEDNYSHVLSLNDLSDYMQLSKEYLCTVFKSKMQTTIMKFLLDLRISHARIFLLQYPEKRVAEISQMCGFDSPSYFGMQFKKIVGVTPENFRRGIHLAEKKQRGM